MTRPVKKFPQQALLVANLKAATQFYHERLGFEVEAYDEKAGTAVVVGPGVARVLLASQDADLTDYAGMKSMPGAWVYQNHSDLDALAEELAARGVKAEGPFESHSGYRHLLVTDPDRYVVVFWQSERLPDQDILRIYRSVPERLRAALEGLSAEDLELRRAPNKWTIRETVHHLVDADLGTFNVLRIALALPGRQITSNVSHPDEWMAGLRCHERPVELAIALFTAAHAWVMEVVDHLPDALDRWVTWPSGYRAEVRNLLFQVGGHSSHHVMQIEEIRQRYGR